MNQEYKKIIDSGFSLESKSNRFGYNRLYLLRGDKRIDYVHYKSNKKMDTVEALENAFNNSHKDVAMRKLNIKIEEGYYYE